MRFDALILYGPPGAGKDTVTDLLAEADERFLLHRRFKVGGNAGSRYRSGTRARLAEFEAAGQLVYSNHRYGSTYGFISSQIEADLRAGIPVLHVGQVEGVRALKSSVLEVRWFSVALWCARQTSAERIKRRGSTDVGRRLVAWDETERDFGSRQDGDFDLVLDTDCLSAQEAARDILTYAERGGRSTG